MSTLWGTDQDVTGYESNPTPGNDGNGTYYVAPGLVGGRSQADISFNVTSTQGRIGASYYSFSLTALNEANGESVAFSPIFNDGTNPFGPGSVGNSESLDFAFLGGAIGYDPNANDTILFTLDADLNNSLIGQDVVTEVIGTGVPDTASTGGLMIAGMGGLIFVRRKFAVKS